MQRKRQGKTDDEQKKYVCTERKCKKDARPIEGRREREYLAIEMSLRVARCMRCIIMDMSGIGFCDEGMYVAIAGIR